MNFPKTNDPSVLIKAGGLVWNSDRPPRKLVVIHRPKYDDWTLPKGKREDKDASWLEAAQREVREETHFETKVLGFAGVTHYTVNDLPSVVLFWEMLRTGDGSRDPKVPDETDEIVWLTPSDATQRMTHAAERRLLAQFMDENAEPSTPTPVIP